MNRHIIYSRNLSLSLRKQKWRINATYWLKKVIFTTTLTGRSEQTEDRISIHVARSSHRRLVRVPRLDCSFRYTISLTHCNRRSRHAIGRRIWHHSGIRIEAS